MAPTEPRPGRDYCVFGVPFWNPPYEEFKRWWDAHIAGDAPPVLLELANPHTLNLAWKNPTLMEVLKNQSINLNDGVGVGIAARQRGVQVKYSYAGTDLMPRLFSEAHAPLRVFFFGATEENNRIAVEKITAAHPRVVCAGRIHGYVDPVKEALPQIAASRSDVLMCALGQPKQEMFMSEHLDALNVRIAVTCGGMFDFFSGAKPRAPLAFRRAGLEWLYRFGLEPRRMFVRYVVGNPVFLMRSRMTRARDVKCVSES